MILTTTPVRDVITPLPSPPLYLSTVLTLTNSESVYVFLRDAETGYLSAGIQVPYSCMTSESDSHLFTYMVPVVPEIPLYRTV